MSRSRISPPTPSILSVCWDRRGIRLSDGALALDGGAEAGATFVGHALTGASRRGQRIITSDVTARLLGARLGPSLATPFHRRFSLGSLELELLPSGVFPGAAALSVSQDGHCLVYAGEVGFGSTLLGLPGPEPRRCDHLVLRPTYGYPRFRFPSASESVGSLVAMALEARGQGRATVLHAASLGAIHALVKPMQGEGLTVRAHRQVHRFLAPLRAAGVALGSVARFEGEVVRGEVLLWPLDALPPVAPRRDLAPCRILVSGLALVPEHLAASGCEAGVPLANNADFGALLAHVLACRPQRVSFVERQAPPLAAELASRGILVEVLGPPEQLEMFPSPAGAAGAGAHSRVS